MGPVSPVPAMIVIRIRRIISFFEEHNATTPDRAIAPEETRRLGQRWMQRLINAGVLMEARPGRFYLNYENLAEFNAARRKRIGIVFAILFLVILVYAILQHNG